MKYKISTDRVIIEHIRSAGEGNAVVVAFPENTLNMRAEGVVTSCDVPRRLLTMQGLNGVKHTYGFDCIVIPEE